MKIELLEKSQIVIKHPLIGARKSFIIEYLSIVEFVMNKFSPNDKWAKAAFDIYKKVLMDGEKFDLLSYKKHKSLKFNFPRFAFFKYRFLLLMDCIYICAGTNYKKGRRIFKELAKTYDDRYRSRVERFFDGLYEEGTTSLLEETKKAGFPQYGELWKENLKFEGLAPYKVAVAANMSAGKSTLINALVGKKVSLAQNLACTSKIHYIVNKPFEDGYSYEDDYNLVLDADEEILMTDHELNAYDVIKVGTRFESCIDEDYGRLWLIDTPGVNSNQNKDHKALTEEFIENEDFDLLLYIMNGQYLGTNDEYGFLDYVSKHYDGRIVFAVNKLDEIDEESIDGILDSVERDLRGFGFKDPIIVPISALGARFSKKKLLGEVFSKREESKYEYLQELLGEPQYRFDSKIRNWKDEDVKGEGEACDLLRFSGVASLEKIVLGGKVNEG